MKARIEGRAMELADMAMTGTEQQPAAEPFPFARSYQIEALEKAVKENTIVFLETGSGKTLIALMLLRNYAYLIRKPSPNIAVFLVPNVVLVTQQAEAVALHTDLKVGKYWGEMGVDYWDAATWRKQVEEFEVFVMTPMILLDALRHSFLSLGMIKVLIFDECHNARGRHPFALIMTEFYHRQLQANIASLPRIFGMTASPVKTKGSGLALAYWDQIQELENLMHSKVYTVFNESVLAKHIPFSRVKLKEYDHVEVPHLKSESLEYDLELLRVKHEGIIKTSNLKETVAESARKKLSKLSKTFLFCLNELGVWLAYKAAESLSCDETDLFVWGRLDDCVETIIRDYSADVLKIFSNHIPYAPLWSVGADLESNMNDGYLSSKVVCLIESLRDYSNLEDLRCIVFVERVVTAIVLQKLLSEMLPRLNGWRTAYTAGNNNDFQSQSRKVQNKIVEEFRKGTVNIIVATSILEEGLDVQSCNLVVRFDLSATVCSFIQSRGRARMRNSDFLLMVRSGDEATLLQVRNYMASGDIMREQSLRNTSIPCSPLDSEIFNEVFYRVESTGAVVTLSSSIALVHFYCSRLPSDGYFKPSPRFEIDKELKICTINFPKSCPLQTIKVEGHMKTLKQLACFEACKQLHQIGALTDNLVPDIVVEEADAQDASYGPYVDEQMNYFPPELVGSANDSGTVYHCYLFELNRKYEYNVPVHNIVLAVKTELDINDGFSFELDTERGKLGIQMAYAGDITLTYEQVLLCQRFQVTLFRVLLDHNLKKLDEVLKTFSSSNSNPVLNYLALPCTSSSKSPSIIDWETIRSVLFPGESNRRKHTNCCTLKGASYQMNTVRDIVCTCMLESSLVFTPHNCHLYSVVGTFRDLDGNSLLVSRNKEEITYKQFYKLRYGIDLHFERQCLLKARRVFPVQNYLQTCRHRKEKAPGNTHVELPPELCFIIMSPLSVATLYSFSFFPSIMHRIECLLTAVNLRRMCLDDCPQTVVIPINKVLEAITTKKCQEGFHLESLETLGDSFLKYAAGQQLFKAYQNQHEGLLSVKKDKIVSNAALCKLGCERKLPGFIRTEPFDPKNWMVPGDQSMGYSLEEELISTRRKVYSRGTKKVKSKTVADAVEALIGAFLSTGGEAAALSFMCWLGIKVDFINTPYERHFPVQPEKLLNVKYLESLLNYSFNDATLLVEALTHGSYMLPEIPGCYQRLEFLGDAVLDHLITLHLYNKYPGMSPGLLTDLRSASVNNDCYALSAIKAKLHKHVLHASQDLHKHIVSSVANFDKIASKSTFGWESELTFPKVLGDIIESLAGAILVDSGYNKDTVMKSIRPLLEPLITPETVKLHPVRELTEYCQKYHYFHKKPVVTFEKRVASITIEVEVEEGVSYKKTCTAPDKKAAKRLACKAILKDLKERNSHDTN